jgi:hypothetical protein
MLLILLEFEVLHKNIFTKIFLNVVGTAWLEVLTEF